MNDKLYNVLKWIAIIALPALATFYTVIAKIWDIPFAVEVPETITAVATLLGALLGISSLNYDKQQSEETEETSQN